jgi:hypothetical protein
MRDPYETGDPIVVPRDRKSEPEEMLTYKVPRLVVVIDDQNTSAHKYLFGNAGHSLC